MFVLLGDEEFKGVADSQLVKGFRIFVILSSSSKPSAGVHC